MLLSFKRLRKGSILNLKSEKEVKETIKRLRAAGFKFAKPGKYVIAITEIPGEVKNDL